MTKLIMIVCVIIASLVMIFSPAKASSSSQPTHVTAESTSVKPVFGMPPTNLPGHDASDQNIPQIIPASTYSHLPSTLYIQIDQEVVCLFAILYEVKQPENYQPPAPVALNRFFLHMFRVIVSPNAP